MIVRDAASHENDTSGPFLTKNTGISTTSLQRIKPIPYRDARLHEISAYPGTVDNVPMLAS